MGSRSLGSVLKAFPQMPHQDMIALAVIVVRATIVIVRARAKARARKVTSMMGKTAATLNHEVWNPTVVGAKEFLRISAPTT